ncbi:N-acetylmuramoyl-L-alanine amidase [Acetivibrio sp. MSJd-27]|uniref:N-acetylmuramoyl-L-alanine amidase n=1 Tax=Acetivibrio sp. MSJd-27 TaxID=2841523 RepID=UPI001C119E0E|nr:N-acetylmuramoyl-L-alanine amidase [Acetivibrio sp. MSJd-27]MBU5450429.1 N-acetylmuramoyl-L-alanine amidase [Acetivibrio sp. MSJd-27]
MIKIFIDPGHNYSGWDTGANGKNAREQDITFQVAYRLRDILRTNYIEVKMSRNNLEDNLGSSVNSSLKARVDSANQWGADYFVSLHCNSYTTEAAKGTETLIISKGGKAEQLAYSINRNIVEQLGMYDRGVKEQNLYVLRNTNMPAVLVEMGFITNETDEWKLMNQQQEFANAIADGILGYLGIQKQDTVDNEVVTVEYQGKQITGYLYNDTTYVKVRQIAALLDKNVEWIGNENKVILTDEN